MKGWTPAGDPVDLLPRQEDAVKSVLAWDAWGLGAILMPRGEDAGGSVILHTASRYSRARAAGRPLQDDPARGAAS
jgi:hypothetical protein